MSFHAHQTVLGMSNLDVEMHIPEIPVTCAPRKWTQEQADIIIKELQEFIAYGKNWQDEEGKSSSQKINEFHAYMDKHAEFVKANSEKPIVKKCSELKLWQEKRRPIAKKPFKILKPKELPKMLQPIQKLANTTTETELDVMCEGEGVVDEDYYRAVKTGGVMNEEQRRIVIDWLFELGSNTKAFRNAIQFAIIHFDLVMKIKTADPDLTRTFMKEKGQLVAAACFKIAQRDGAAKNKLSTKDIIEACDNPTDINTRTLVSKIVADDKDDETGKKIETEGEVDRVLMILFRFAAEEKYPVYTVADFVEYYLFGFFDLMTAEYEKNPPESVEVKRSKEDERYFSTTMVLLDRASMDIEWVMYLPSLLAAIAFRLISDVYIERIENRRTRNNKLFDTFEQKMIQTCVNNITNDITSRHTVDDYDKCHRFLSRYYEKRDFVDIANDSSRTGRTRSRDTESTDYKYLNGQEQKTNTISPSGN